MDIKRKPDEAYFPYKERLVVAKLEGEIDLDWSDIVELLGDGTHPDTLRKAAYGIYEAYKYRLESSLDISSQDVLEQLEAKKIEIQKERYKLFDQRNALNKIIREKMSRKEEVNEIIKECVASNNLPEFKPVVLEEKKYKAKTMLVSLNDIHYGQNIENSWNVYNPEVCEDRFSEYAAKIVEIQEKENVEECVVWGNGDFISGNIHNEISVTNKENVIQQVIQVSELISGFLYFLSKHFKKIRFVSVAGNHSRISKKEDALKDERLDDMIEWFLKARLQNLKNISFDEYDKIDTTMYIVNIQGLNFIGVHGDYDNLDNGVNRLISMVDRPIYGILTGHLHHHRIDTIQGVKTIMGGSFLGMDSFCIEKRIYGKPEQLVCIVDNEGLECSYNIEFKK